MSLSQSESIILHKRVILHFITCDMFTPICGGYHPWDKFFIYHCDNVTMDYNAILLTFASERLLERCVKRKVVL